MCSYNVDTKENVHKEWNGCVPHACVRDLVYPVMMRLCVWLLIPALPLKPCAAQAWQRSAWSLGTGALWWGCQCYASRQTYVEVKDTYSEGGTHEETLRPQSKAKVLEQETRRQGHNQTDCGFIRLTLWLHRTRMRREVQAEQVFKYYWLPKWKVVERDGRLGKHDYHGRGSQGERQSCDEIRN